MMLSPRPKKSISLEELPKPLRMGIAKVMASFDLDVPEALERAAVLLDINSSLFKKEVAKGAELKYKSRFFTQFNNARTTVERDAQRKIDVAFKKGYDQGYMKAKAKFEITFDCDVCNRPVSIQKNVEPHMTVKAFLRQRRWRHGSCHEKKN